MHFWRSQIDLWHRSIDFWHSHARFWRSSVDLRRSLFGFREYDPEIRRCALLYRRRPGVRPSKLRFSLSQGAQRHDTRRDGVLFPDAELAEDDAEEFLGVGVAYDVADGVHGGAEFFGNELGG